MPPFFVNSRAGDRGGRNPIRMGATMGADLFDNHDRETHPSFGWRVAGLPGVYTMEYDWPEDEPAYSLARPFEAGTEYVYFVHAPEVGRIKIGTSSDVSQRLVDLQIGSPCKLHLIKLLPGGRELEETLHTRFRRFHVAGEWFSDEVLDEWVRLSLEDDEESEDELEVGTIILPGLLREPSRGGAE